MASERTDAVASVKLEKGVILEGPLWPEPVRISGVESYGDLWQVDAVGLRTRQFYPGTIRALRRRTPSLARSGTPKRPLASTHRRGS